MKHLLCSFFAIFAFACVSQPVTFQNVGVACLDPISLDNSHQIDILLATHSNLCGEVLEASCTAILEGDIIEISSTLTFIPPNPRAICLDQFAEHKAGCSLDGLPEGDYVLDYGGQQVPFRIPLEIEEAQGPEEENFSCVTSNTLVDFEEGTAIDSQ